MRSEEITSAVTTAPDGSEYRLPSTDEIETDFAEIARAASNWRAKGGTVVVVQGLGFVGAAVAAVVAGARNGNGDPLHYVIGADLNAPASYWKVAKIRSGVAPMAGPDPELARLTHDAVHVTRNLTATASESAYSLADVILVDIHLDARMDGDVGLDVDLDAFAAALRSVGRQMRGDALVLLETTVPPGTSETVVLPILRQERLRRGIEEPLLLAHCYERVMPGPKYVDSIRRMWRTFSGIDTASSQRTSAFLSTIIDTESHPLWELDNPTSSELAKVLENSYRALNIAFIHEWTLLAEQIGVDLFEVVDSIRVRTGTHDNMRYPGLGVGGYCLTKDSLLAQWGASELLGSDIALEKTIDAVKTNAMMPLHTVDVIRELLDGDIAGKRIAVCGAAYLADVADTRFSPSETLVGALESSGASIRVHDPCVIVWPERPDLAVTPRLPAALAGADAVVFAVPHSEYRRLSAADIHECVGGSSTLVDANNVVSDGTAEALHASGWRVAGVGKGHWRREGYPRRRQ